MNTKHKYKLDSEHGNIYYKYWEKWLPISTFPHSLIYRTAYSSAQVSTYYARSIARYLGGYPYEIIIPSRYILDLGPIEKGATNETDNS